MLTIRTNRVRLPNDAMFSSWYIWVLAVFFGWEFVWDSKIKGNVLSLLRQFVCLPCCPIRLFSVCNVTWKYKQKVLFGIKLEWMKQLHKNLNSHLLGSLSKICGEKTIVFILFSFLVVLTRKLWLVSPGYYLNVFSVVFFTITHVYIYV